MQVRAKKKPPVHKGETPKQPVQAYTFVAPIQGWVLDENPALASQGTARVLDNFICTTTGIRARGGKTRIATLNAAATALFRYEAGGVDTLFAATASEITDITSPADPAIPEAADVTGLTGGEWVAAQIGTTGGNFITIVNGANEPLQYNGSAWSTPAITGTTTTDLSHIWTFANRYFFIQKNSLSTWYLPVDSIAGALTEFSLGSVFQRGGSLVFGASWSMDAGDGLDDKCIFVTSEGEVAVFQGTDPSDVTNWALEGRYDLPKPLGKKAFTKTGGDILIATEAGLIPVSSAVNMDIAAQGANAISRRISSYWQSQADTIPDGWEIVKLPRSNIAIVSQPSVSIPTALCVNLQTAAWSRFTGWDTSCLEIYQDRGVFGEASGAVYSMDVGGSDDGALYTCRLVSGFEVMGVPAQTKTSRQSRFTFQAGTPYNAKLAMKVDFDLSESTPPAPPADFTTDTWDSGKWDEAVWDATSVVTSSAVWQSTPGTGVYFAPELQLSFNVTPTPIVELVSIDTTFSPGGLTV